MARKILMFALVVVLAAGGSAFALPINEVEPNNSIAGAQNVDAFFSLEYDANINSSTTIPHVSISGRGSDDGTDRDYFSFTITTPGATAQFGLFDIDNGMNDLDSWINLYNSTGSLLAANDDWWGGGDAGSVHGYDSYMGYTFTTPGVYTIAVGRYPSLSGMYSSQDYTLNISIENHSVNSVPEPGTMLLLGSGLLGLVGIRRKVIA